MDGTLCCAATPARSAELCALRSFLRFASEDGLAGTAAADAVPAVPSRKQARIPSIWDPDDVARILEAVDRGSPCGKRDYAIILLAARLGLRGFDVKRLEFSDFDWPGNRLSAAQAKTGRRVQLPLLVTEESRHHIHRCPGRVDQAERLPGIAGLLK